MSVVRQVKKFAEVPSTWEGWVMRVMTVFVVLVLVAAVMLYHRVNALEKFIANSRSERNIEHEVQAERICVALVQLRVSPRTLERVECTPR